MSPVDRWEGVISLGIAPRVPQDDSPLAPEHDEDDEPDRQAIPGERTQCVGRDEAKQPADGKPGNQERNGERERQRGRVAGFEVKVLLELRGHGQPDSEEEFVLFLRQTDASYGNNFEIVGHEG